MTEIMFETFNTPAFYIAMQEVLALYASGRSTGIVVHSGYDVSRTVPINEGYPSLDAISEMYLGGKDLTRYLGKSLSATDDMNIVREIKDKICFVADDVHDELQKSKKLK